MSTCRIDGPMDDETFRRGIQRRVPAIWSQLVARYDPPLRRQAGRILTIGMDTENAVGEMWYRALKNAWRYDPTRPPYPWLARICLNTCLNQRERELRVVQDRTEAPGREDLRGDEASRALREALQALPKRQRQVVALRFLFEVSIREIAVLIHRSPKTVEKTLFRGLRRLRETAEESGLWTLREGA